EGVSSLRQMAAVFSSITRGFSCDSAERHIQASFQTFVRLFPGDSRPWLAEAAALSRVSPTPRIFGLARKQWRAKQRSDADQTRARASCLSSRSRRRGL